MGLVVVILFPAGALLMRAVRSPWIHAGIQVLNLALLIAGLGLGVKLAQFKDYVSCPFLLFHFWLCFVENEGADKE